MRGSMLAAAAVLVIAGCNNPTTGGSVANGDAKNYPYQAPDPARAGEANPTGSDSGPWIGEYGLMDATTGMNDRWPAATEPAPPTLPTPAAGTPSVSAPNRIRNRDEREHVPPHAGGATIDKQEQEPR